MSFRNLICVTIFFVGVFTVIHSAEAKNGGRTAVASASADRVRLQAKFALDEIDGADEAVEIEGRELRVRFESRSGRARLDSEASGFEAGTVIQVYVGNIKIGDITVEAGTLEGEISFRDAASWPSGLPMNLLAGTVVTFRDAANAVLATGPLQAK